MKTLDYDPIDKYLSRCLKNWSRQIPLPRDGKEKLFSQIGHAVPEMPLYLRVLQTISWLLRNVILVPLDFLISPMVYSTSDGSASMRYHERLDLSLAVRSVTIHTLSHGFEIFTYVA